MTSFWTILVWLFHGLVQYILYWVPVLEPYPEEDWPPSAWFDYNSYSDWWDHKDVNGRPDEHLIQRWFTMTFGELKALTLEEAKPYVDAIYSVLQSLIGYIKTGFASTGAWLNSVATLLGDWLPWWSATVGVGLSWLFDHLPWEISQDVWDWATLWESIKSDVRSWARLTYDAAKFLAIDAWGWITLAGYGLSTWWDGAHAWLDWLSADPYGAIVFYLGWAWEWLADFASNGRDRVFEWLGPYFPQLLDFSRDCVVFYYNLWSIGWDELGDFVSDPLHWVIDRLERAIVERW